MLLQWLFLIFKIALSIKTSLYSAYVKFSNAERVIPPIVIGLSLQPSLPQILREVFQAETIIIFQPHFQNDPFNLNRLQCLSLCLESDNDTWFATNYYWLYYFSEMSEVICENYNRLNSEKDMHNLIQKSFLQFTFFFSFRFNIRIHSSTLVYFAIQYSQVIIVQVYNKIHQIYIYI